MRPSIGLFKSNILGVKPFGLAHSSCYEIIFIVFILCILLTEKLLLNPPFSCLPGSLFCLHFFFRGQVCI